MYMLDGYFHLYHVKPIFLADLPNQLYRSFLDLFSLKDIFSVFRTPHQVVTRIVDRMTRSFDHHAWYISCLDARAYEDKGDAPLPPYNPLGKACIHPRGKPRGILQRIFIKNLPFYVSDLIREKPPWKMLTKYPEIGRAHV